MSTEPIDIAELLRAVDAMRAQAPSDHMSAHTVELGDSLAARLAEQFGDAERETAARAVLATMACLGALVGPLGAGSAAAVILNVGAAAGHQLYTGGRERFEQEGHRA